MKNFIVISSLTLTSLAHAQERPKEYSDLIKKADSLYTIKEYKKSAFTYSEAFKANGWKAGLEDRYNAACSWAMASYPDSAFFNLNRIAGKSNYSDVLRVKADPDLNSLHDHKQWKPLLDLLQKNKDKEEINYNKPLVKILDSIYTEDQAYRLQLEDIESKYGHNSYKIDSLWQIIDKKDAANLMSVTKILDQQGWLGPETVGQRGNTTLFLVIQHADQKTQEKYLPMMRDAVKNGKAHAANLALLEDRVALGQNKKQIYGSQIGRDPLTGKDYVMSLEDPDNVDKRRKEVGLQPLQDYLNYWNLKWNVEEYKKEMQAKEKK